MGRIKSALEIALEKTESVKGDKSSITQFKAKQWGKRQASEFLEGKGDLKKAMKETPEDERESFRQGVFEFLLAQIGLPVSEGDIKKIENVGKALALIIADGGFIKLYDQLAGALGRYLDEAAQYDEAIKRQYAPKLRQKEEELSRRMGREIRIDPFQDPEFVTFYNQNINALKANYESAIAQVKERAQVSFDKQ
ncbi:hypothetical protein AGMMS49928_03210 [Spirochaetia bacterium]|nr:hypothetical protein AGMMS49928_03210 [Spirochaetia bacterium]